MPSVLDSRDDLTREDLMYDERTIKEVAQMGRVGAAAMARGDLLDPKKVEAAKQGESPEEVRNV
jgi:hypothetical protein